MLVSLKCAFRLNTNPQCPLSSTLPPPVPDFVFMKGGHLKCPVQAQQLPLRPRHPFRSSTKGGQLFLFFFSPFDKRLCALLCWTPSSFYFEALSLGGCSFCVLQDGGRVSAPPSFNHLIWPFCNPRGPSGARQQSHSTAGHCRQTPWPKPPAIHTCTYTHKIKKTNQPCKCDQKGGEPPAVFKSHNNVWQIELHFVNSHRPLIWCWYEADISVMTQWAAYTCKHAFLSAQV